MSGFLVDAEEVAEEIKRLASEPISEEDKGAAWGQGRKF